MTFTEIIIAVVIGNIISGIGGPLLAVVLSILTAAIKQDKH